MRLNVRRAWTGAKALALGALLCVGFTQGAYAQNEDAEIRVEKEFQVCPLNVDGLPTSILGIEINPDGKGADGAKAIGEYLKNKGIDVVAMSEDFNYHSDLIGALGSGYSVGTYRGGLTMDNYNANISFNTDGLGFLAKSPVVFSNESWTEWNEKYGKFTNGADELIRKGFRYYTVDLGDGVLVDFYIMHMDAETDAEDNAARASQWAQLCAAIQARNSGRPVIVMGDTNSRYTRDDIYGKFITPLSSDYDVTDAWVKLCQNGTAPTLGAEALVIPSDQKLSSAAYRNYEIVDKVIYLNPKNAAYTLEAETIDFDADNYQSNGELLGDHVPVIVKFKATGTIATKLEPTAASAWWRGEKVVGNGQPVYIYNVGAQRFVDNGNTSKIVQTDINNATKWNINGSSSYTIADLDNNYRFQMAYSWFSWHTGLVQGSGATTFAFVESTKTIGAYKFTSSNRYFNVDSKYEYTAAETDGTWNDWFLISEEQKTAYNTYNALYSEALSYLSQDLQNDNLMTDLKGVLATTANSNYDRSAADNKLLQNIIDKIKEWLAGFDKKITVAKYGSICLPYDAIVPDGLTVYYATAYNADSKGSSIHLEPFDSKVIPANTGFLLWADVTETTSYNFAYTATQTPDADATSKMSEDGNIFKGTIVKIENENLQFDRFKYMLLGNQKKGVGFYRLDSTSYVPANCAYLELSTSGSTADASAYEYAKFNNDGDATAIDGVQSQTGVQPRAVYGMSGERRSGLQPGINIVKMSDGTTRKVVVK